MRFKRSSSSEPAVISPEAETGDGATPSIQFNEVSRWFGDIVALSDVSFKIGPGVTGLLGPNGAGKSTALKIMAGLLPPSSGDSLIKGKPARSDLSAYSELGLVAEHEVIYPFLTGREYVLLNAKLQGLKNAKDATEQAIDLVNMGYAAERKVGGFSKGMRQRIKIAGAMVHNPDVILMDEPLNGTDPVQRAEIIRLIRQLGREGKTVVVSSHVLVEVERFAQDILVIINGKLAAAGDFHTIRDSIDSHDHEIRIVSSDARGLAGLLFSQPMVSGVRIDKQGRLLVQTTDVKEFFRMVPAAAQHSDIRLFEMQPTDDSLQSVFSYLVQN